MCNLIRHHLIICRYLLPRNKILKHWHLCKKTGLTKEDPPELWFSAWLDSMAVTCHNFFLIKCPWQLQSPRVLPSRVWPDLRGPGRLLFFYKRAGNGCAYDLRA